MRQDPHHFQGTSAHERIVEVASTLFYRDGIRATGIDTIIEQAGVAKMTFYKHFKSKDILVQEFLRRRDERWRAWLTAEVEQRSLDPRERLLAIFDVLGDWFQSPDFRGCAFIRAAFEFADTHHPAHLLAAEHKRLVRAYVVGLAQEAGLRDPEQLGQQLTLLMDGAIVAALLEEGYGSAQAARQSAAALLATV